MIVNLLFLKKNTFLHSLILNVEVLKYQSVYWIQIITSFIDDSSGVEGHSRLYFDNKKGHGNETKTIRS